ARNSDINKGTSVKVVKGKIWDRFGAMFFKYKGEYFAYSHLLRCRHYYLRKRQPELFTALSKHLNRKSGLNLTEERWLGILDDPKNQKEITQFKEIDELFSNITGVAKTVAEYYKQKAAIQIKKRNKKKR
ncbi:MAG: hypothetical protein OEL89_03440, partial [Candidatus Peregrinibacteria bacterium]|nr:hypothetical protein [Candidatus Peregrinibacteria bacterium]